ncbi:MAG: 3-deoxy-D-manno-octulosonate cytidylyltransferase [Elusimicrobia bacterium RIFOXYA2_FULL_69_6]|nr:MAG: 3-deoxy-D-manno-octulosonate cytidylyltransferase [Elusimicrobia bacterium RIFOXYA2_FULL_69_6]
MKDCLVVIPARLGSVRFPAKVLAPLGGRPVVEWCWRAARAAGVGPVLVATDDERVRRVVAGFGGEAVLTPRSCASGSDRVARAARGRREPLIINLQGDMPFIKGSTVRAVAELLRRRPSADMATAVTPLAAGPREQDPNVVKAALACDGRALYFSRAAIPFPREGGPARRLEHLGIYGFRRRSLEHFVRLPPSRLERCECLEQLRALEDGMSIYAAVVSERPVAIDTPADLRRAERMLRDKRK